MTFLINSKVGTRLQSYKILLTRHAKNDIAEIGDYIAYTLLEPELAYKFIHGLQKSITSLQLLPSRHSLIPKNLMINRKIHCLPYQNYYVFYDIVEKTKTVVVLRIGYNRRNWNEILR